MDLMNILTTLSIPYHFIFSMGNEENGRVFSTLISDLINSCSL